MDFTLEKTEEGTKLNIKKGDLIIDTENNNNEVEITNLTSSSVEVFLKKNENFYTLDVECEKCGKKYNIKKGEKFFCSSVIGTDEFEKNIFCRTKKYTELKKVYSGIDCSNWFTHQSFVRRFKK